MKNILWLCIAITAEVFAQGNFPQKGWKQYDLVSDAGFSAEKLLAVKKLHNEMKGGALLVVHDGAIVLSLGEPSRRFMDHSMRKSYMSAMFGIYSANGSISLDKDLTQLGIDDLDPLTTEEKKATITDLLSARSGVYHPSAYSPRGMAERLPDRGSHPHGTFWYYNNWDFNTLVTIFNQETGKDFFKAFKSDIAEQIGMEDFDLGNTFYRYEDNVSKHPAYLFRLSARDEARFGLLYLNNGKWGRKQLVPATWIEKSTYPITTDLEGFGSRGGYGYLWWTGEFAGVPGYYASGSGGQRIVILPSRNLVIVQSTDTYDGSKGINDKKLDELMGLIVSAQDGEPKRNPSLKNFIVHEMTYTDTKVDPSLITAYVGTYQHRFLGQMEIEFKEGVWMLNTTSGSYRLHPQTNSEFIPEDIYYSIHMQKADKPEDRGKIKAETAADRSLIRIIFEY